jgi:hypothetical protein
VSATAAPATSSANGAPDRSRIPPVRELLDAKRYWLPMAAACLCLIGASVLAPIFAWVLLIAAFGFILDGATAWFANAGSTGGMHDYKQ